MSEPDTLHARADRGPRFATRLNSFRADGRSARAALEAVAAVPGVSAVELNYPQHFHGEDADVLARARDLGLAITALNLRWDGPEFRLGAFTSPDAAAREAAVARAVEAVHRAAAESIDHVILWMGPDGHDYPFQVDYARVWDLEIEGFAAVAAADRSVRVSVEPKPDEPRQVSLIKSMSDALLAVAEVAAPNFGVTLDYCHLLMAGETPAQAAALALRQGKLFGVHLNDGYGRADDGLMVGTVTLPQTLELLIELRAGGFDGTYYFDTFPTRVDPAAECAANVRTVRRLLSVVDTVDIGALRRCQAAQDAVGASALIQAALLGLDDA